MPISQGQWSSIVVVYQNVTIGRKSIDCSDPKMTPTIEENVIIYPGAVIAGGITVGTNSIIAPNAVVTKDAPPNSLVVGFNGIKARTQERAGSGA